ncbi:hypothetical protein ACX4MT_00045 [Roseomonas mucosa]
MSEANRFTIDLTVQQAATLAELSSRQGRSTHAIITEAVEMGLATMESCQNAEDEATGGRPGTDSLEEETPF